MAEEDDATYRQRIIDLLNRHGFGWVIAQAELQIAEGKPSAKQVSERELPPFSEDPMFAIRRPRSRRASLITSEPYSESERLEIVLQGIEAAVLQRSLVEQAVVEELHDISAIRFEPEGPLGVVETSPLGRSHRIDPSRRSIAIQLASEAREALANIRGRHRDST